jgi:hypothetical protein
VGSGMRLSLPRSGRTAAPCGDSGCSCGCRRGGPCPCLAGRSSARTMTMASPVMRSISVRPLPAVRESYSSMPMTMPTSAEPAVKRAPPGWKWEFWDGDSGSWRSSPEPVQWNGAWYLPSQKLTAPRLVQKTETCQCGTTDCQCGARAGGGKCVCGPCTDKAESK